jgi:hypothetical protein
MMVFDDEQTGLGVLRDGERKKDVSRPIYLQRDEASCPARVVLRFGGPILGG